MVKRLLVLTKCPLCGDHVEEVPDGILKQKPHHNNAEFVVTHSGHKQYIHTSCWNEMIENQKLKNKGENYAGKKETISAR